MSERMRMTDWSKTPFGAVETWPASLKTSISIMLASRFAMVVAWGPEFRLFYNDRYRPILGVSKHPGALGSPAIDIFPEAWPFIGPLFESTRRGESVALDDVLIPLDRYGYLENCYFTLSYSPIRDESGGVGGMLAVVAETTERVEGERRLKTLRELARRSAEAETPQQACDNAAASLQANPIDVPFCLFYLFDGDSGQARRVSTAGIAPDVPASAWPLHEIAESRQVRVLDDLRQRCGDLPGEAYPEPVHSAILVPLARPGQPRADGVLVFGVSPRRALDDTYRGFYDLAADQILSGIRNALARQEERQRAEALAELDRAKTTFFSNVSHEFRTPLTLMLGPLENLLNATDNSLPREIHDQVETAHRNSLRLLKLVNTLLDFSRIEAGRIEAAYESLDLAAYTAELASVFRSTIERAGLKFVVDCPPLGEPAYVDRDMWEKIVFNLLSNAFKFTLEGTITVSLQRAGDRANLTVSDTGTGIPAEELPHVFERFHRVKGARGRTYEGTGIGLALVQELVRMHNGTAQAASSNGGSTFTVSIPLGHTHLPAHRIGTPRTLATTNVGAAGYLVELQRWLSNATTENSPISLPLSAFSSELPPVAPAAAAKRARVLLADDNADMREYVTRLLSSQFEVVCAADGQSALELAQREKPDLILSDIMMPRLDGLGLLQAIRSDSELCAIPVILLSARAGEEARVSGLTAGADDYLVKPFGARELMARVETHIQMMNVRRHSEQTIRGLKEELQIQLERERARAAELEAIMAALPAPVFIGKDPQSRFIYGNRAAYELLRLPQGSNLSLTGPAGERADFKVFKDGSEVQTNNLPSQAAARGVEQRDIEIEIVVGNAAPAHLYGNVVPLRDTEGSPYGSIATFVDITERKRAVQRLALQYEVATIMANADSIEEALRGLLPTVGENLGWDVGEIWSRDREADCLRCVTHWQRSSVSAENFITTSRQMTFSRGAGLPGRVWQTCQPAWIEDVSLDDNFARLAAASREHLHGAVAFPILFKDELLGVIEFFSRRLAPPDAAVLRMLAAIGSQVGQFIERKRMEAERNQLLAAEQSARAQLEQEREILEVVNRSGLMLSAELDLERLVQALTDAATDITGAQFGSFFYNLLDDRGGSYMLYTLSGVPREHFSNFPMPRATDLFGPTFRGQGIVRLHDVKQDARFGKNSPYHGMPKGHLTVTSYLAVPVISRSGEVLGGLFFGHSEAGIFTERHELIVSGLASQAAIAIDNARLYEAAHKAKSEAERANRLKDDFLATVSHELRTPLTAMLGWSRLLRGGKLDERKKAQGLEILERNAFAQQQIIEDILDASRIIAGKLRLQASPVEIASVVETVMASMKPAADDKGVKLQAAFPNGSIVVLGDAGRLQQIVWNLVSNAVKFTPSGGEVNVTVERIDARAQVTVRDTGQGIDKEFLPFVFERFRQADSSSTRQFGGLGLGLAIVRHLTELHGGAVSAFSAGEGQGSTFTINLPLAASQESKAASNALASPHQIENNLLSGHGNLEGIRVLAVDDEADTRELLTVLLTQCKVEVRTAGSAAEALATVEDWQPDLLISDLAMPDEDGITLIRKLRALPAAKGGSIPAIALTAYAHSDDRENALAAGYQRHIAKPVEPSELVAALSALAGMKRKAKQPAV